MDDLTPDQVTALLQALPGMPAKEQEALLADLDALAERKAVQAARDDFLAFCHRVYPGFKEGPHHRFMKPILHRVQDGTELRVTISMPPRMGKSESVAYLFVAWYLGHNPSHHIIMVTHTADLSATFGRKIRELIDSPVYAEIFPDTVVAKDKAAAANWLTTLGGKYLAIGIGANVAGHGAHCLDPRAKVVSERGRVPIIAVKPGDLLYTKGGWRRVTKKLLTIHKTSISINGRLRASIDHKFYTQRGWVEAQDLMPGDCIETLTLWRTIWAKIHLLKVRLTRLGAA